MKVTLWREKALNAMNPAFFEELAAAFRQIKKSENVRAVILNAEGKVFTAGLDLKEAASILTLDPDAGTMLITLQTPLVVQSNCMPRSGSCSNPLRTCSSARCQ